MVDFKDADGSDGEMKMTIDLYSQLDTLKPTFLRFHLDFSIRRDKCSMLSVKRYGRH